MTHARHAYGPLVRVLREARRMTLIELSGASGLSAGYISRVERGSERTASQAATEDLAAALGVTPEHLTGQVPPWRPLRKLIVRMTREAFASSVGLTEEELINIENGTETPDDRTAELLAARLGVPLSMLGERLT
jgi:transcriptional regulator with XRE-family HTH domain